MLRGLATTRDYTCPPDRIPLLYYADELLGEGETHLIERIHEKHVKSNRRKTYPRGRVSRI